MRRDHKAAPESAGHHFQNHKRVTTFEVCKPLMNVLILNPISSIIDLPQIVLSRPFPSPLFQDGRCIGLTNLRFRYTSCCVLIDSLLDLIEILPCRRSLALFPFPHHLLCLQINDPTISTVLCYRTVLGGKSTHPSSPAAWPIMVVM